MHSPTRLCYLFISEHQSDAPLPTEAGTSCSQLTSLYTRCTSSRSVKMWKSSIFFFSLSVFYYVYVILHPNVSMETSAPHLHADAIRQRRLCLGEKGRRWLAAASRRKTAMCPFPGHSLTHMCTNACVFHKNH